MLFSTALKLHPDKQKNPTPASIKAFHDVQVAYELLCDPEGRKALDTLLGAQVRAAARKAQLNSKRAALQEDLERRERAAENRAELERAQNVLQAHMDRIRAENIRRMQRERAAPEPAAPRPAEPQKRARTLTPFSQQYGSLEQFEEWAFEQLRNNKR